VFSWFLSVVRDALSSWLARGERVQLGLQDVSMPARGSPPRWRGPNRPPGDPTPRVRQPKSDRPYGRNGAIAVVEPDESQTVSAVAIHRVGVGCAKPALPNEG
jgi:hypothetical protein